MSLSTKSPFENKPTELVIISDTHSESIILKKLPLSPLNDSNANQLCSQSTKASIQELSPTHSDLRSKESTCISELSITSPTIHDDLPEGQNLEVDETLDDVLYNFEGSQEPSCESSHQTAIGSFPAGDILNKHIVNQSELNPQNSAFDNRIPNKPQVDLLPTKSPMQSTKTSHLPKITSKSIASKLTPEDEQVLLRLVVQLKNSWKKIAKRFNNLRQKNVTVHALRTRYSELAPKLFKKKGKFTHQEDLLLAKYYADYGSDWSKIAAHVKNRTPNMLKNRYYSYIRKKKILNVLLDELHMRDQNLMLAQEQPITESLATNKFNEHEIEIIHLLIEKQEQVTFRTMEFPVINTGLFEMNCISPEDELHVKITPVSIPMNITKFSFDQVAPYEPYMATESTRSENINIEEPIHCENIETFFDFKSDREENNKISFKMNHTYGLRERKSKMNDYLYKRNEYW